MPTPAGWIRLFLAVAAASLAAASAAPSVSVAAASNLVYTLDALHAAFRREAPEIVVTTTTGASGGLFAQIANGAPFDVLLSADTEYPKKVAAQKLGDPVTLRTFATGRLVVWTMRPEVSLGNLAAALRDSSVRKIAIAQPRTAPYGRAAQAALEKLGVWDEVRPKVVVGENVSQTAQFVETGNADLGFVALSLVQSDRLAGRGSWREVPAELYGRVSLDHALVLTLRGAANPAAHRYLQFLASDAAKKILRAHGYGVP